MTAPLDGQITDFVAPVKPAAPDLSKPSLEALAWVLENNRLPDEWEWDFSQEGGCGTAGCAIGVSSALWRPIEDADGWDEIGAMFGLEWPFPMSMAELRRKPMAKIFLSGQHDCRITPAVVAGRIRDHLAGRPIRYLVEGDRS